MRTNYCERCCFHHLRRSYQWALRRWEKLRNVMWMSRRQFSDPPPP
ncbi:hypothetical protein MOQ_000020, partial [Trypanosoma cruzi marinkellei]